MTDYIPLLLILYAGILHHVAGLAMLLADDAKKESAYKDARLYSFIAIAENIGAAVSLGLGIYLALNKP